jgi:hypothetical protein
MVRLNFLYFFEPAVLADFIPFFFHLATLVHVNYKSEKYESTYCAQKRTMPCRGVSELSPDILSGISRLLEP